MSRVLLRSLLALIVVAAAALVGWRVLGPAEVLASVEPPFPATRAHRPGPTGRLAPAPLIVGDTIRVYAGERQVRADAPVDAKTVYTAIWSFRRWPSKLSGVVAIGGTVVSRWSDGDLIALDGRTGKIVWRASGPAAPGFAVTRTSSEAVWAPPGLHVAGTSVVVTAGGRVYAYDISTGTRRWTASPCPSAFTTAGGQVVCPAAVYDAATGAPVAGFPAGPYTPVACDVAASSCAALRDGAGHGWLTGAAPSSPAPTPFDVATPAMLSRAPALDRPGSTVAGGLFFYADAAGLHAVSATGEIVSSYPAGTLVLGTSAGRPVLLGAARRLTVGSRHFPLEYDNEGFGWRPGRWQVTGRYVAIERLSGGEFRPYFTASPVIVAAL